MLKLEVGKTYLTDTGASNCIGLKETGPNSEIPVLYSFNGRPQFSVEDVLVSEYVKPKKKTHKVFLNKTLKGELWFSLNEMVETVGWKEVTITEGDNMLKH